MKNSRLLFALIFVLMATISVPANTFDFQEDNPIETAISFDDQTNLEAFSLSPIETSTKACLDYGCHYDFTAPTLLELDKPIITFRRNIATRMVKTFPLSIRSADPNFMDN